MHSMQKRVERKRSQAKKIGFFFCEPQSTLTSGCMAPQNFIGVLSRELPPLQRFRPDLPPVIDSILRKMTQKVSLQYMQYWQ